MNLVWICNVIGLLVVMRELEARAETVLLRSKCTILGNGHPSLRPDIILEYLKMRHHMQSIRSENHAIAKRFFFTAFSIVHRGHNMTCLHEN